MPVTRMLIAVFLSTIGLIVAAPPVQAETTSQLGAQLESLVARHLGVFVTVPKQRDPSERITLEGSTLTIRFLRPVTGDRAEALCDGGRWLLVGRLDKTRGARALFTAAKRVNRLRLEFVDIQTTVHPSAQGVYEQHRSIRPQLTFELSRERALQLQPRVLRKTLTGKRCSSLIRSLLDRVSVAGE